MKIINNVAYLNFCTQGDLDILRKFIECPTERKKKNLLKKVEKLKETADSTNFSIYAKVDELTKVINLIYNGDVIAVLKAYITTSESSFKIPDYMSSGECKCMYYDGGIVVRAPVDIGEDELSLFKETLLGVNKGEISDLTAKEQLVTYCDSLTAEGDSYKDFFDLVRMYIYLTYYFHSSKILFRFNDGIFKYHYWNKSEK